MKEYLEFRLACQELIAMGYALGFNYNHKTQDWRAVASYPGVGVRPWHARGVSIENAALKMFEQIKSGVRT